MITEGNRRLSVKMDDGGETLSNVAPSVLPINRRTIHQICSGQVVLNLATAIKELLENSIDAGATSVDIKLRDNGAVLVEVSDNGSGVEPYNFEALTLKHHTSKLREFSDLTSVETFGFRGEALSSLCALSNLTIWTRHSSQVVGTKLEYDHNGQIITRSACAREQGTTVNLTNLFSTLPVRHKEFLRNIKREFVKLVHVLHGYCLISKGVRITCSNQVENGRKMTIVSTSGSEQIRDNIACVFGPKQVQSLMVFKQIPPSEEECIEYNITGKDNQSSLFEITGFISKADHGLGRSSADRQFLYINKRPCDLTKVSRVVNEVYHMFNRHQYPFVMLDISLQRDGVDVNVTPDKRQVFLQQEKLLLATLKCSLKAMFDSGTSSYDVNQKPFNQFAPLVSKKQEPDLETEKQNDEPNENASIRDNHSPNVFPSLRVFKRLYSSISDDADVKKQPKAKQAKLTNFCNTKNNFVHQVSKEKPVWNDADIAAGHPDKAPSLIVCKDELTSNLRSLGCDKDELQLVNETKTEKSDNNVKHCESNKLGPDVVDLSGDSPTKDQGIELVEQKSTDKPISIKQKAARSPNGIWNDDALSGRVEVPIEFNMTKLRKSLALKEKEKNFKNTAKTRVFRAKISPENNNAAEEELTKHITKQAFAKMEILGQFNLGFVLTRLDDDLFIIDQHASDEKYNFEREQKNTVLRAQRLIFPKKLELTAVNEFVLMDNIAIFRKNGFDFEIDENAETTHKVKLVSVPVSKNWTFGVEDVEELIFMLSDSPGVMTRPTRVRKMFASRACRMSVMIGTALNREQMKDIVVHMGEIDHPWNCPHGRPTMRHLVNLNMVAAADS